MSIVKMVFISIVGLKNDFDRFVRKYIANNSIQLENALGMLDNVKGLLPFTEENPYSMFLKRSSAITAAMELDTTGINSEKPVLSVEEIHHELDLLEQQLQDLTGRKESIEKQLNESYHLQKQLEIIGDLDVELQQLFSLEFTKFRFGKMPKKSYKQLQLYLEELEVIVIPVSQDEDSVWMVYFTPRAYGDKIDGIFSSLYFERTRISGDVKGHASEAADMLAAKVKNLQEELKAVNNELKAFVSVKRETALQVHHSATFMSSIFDIRKYAAHTRESFYLIGWIPADELARMAPLLDQEKNISYIVEEADIVKSIQPPTLLRNNRLFRPFEMLVGMYGLPSYSEIDPTAFVAVTYFIMFGMMFGDVGQGILLAIAGLALMKLQPNFGGVLMGAGISSTLFGFLYGSVFGFEHWLPTLWLKPMENINTILATAIFMGIIFITAAMVFNIINSIKGRNITKMLFDRNGLAGFIFYWAVILFALYFVNTGKIFISTGFMLLCLLLPLAAIFFKEPLENLIHRKKHILPQDKGGFFVETFFELFDMLMSLASNTISFVRVSAFALNHAGLFAAVFILSGMTDGIGSVIEIILGNIFIIGLEGLIVGIQALRLEYYELFSKFYTGDGRPYKPFRNQIHTS